jgi:hypothetical protein
MFEPAKSHRGLVSKKEEREGSREGESHVAAVGGENHGQPPALFNRIARYFVLILV